jgi:hypothetical protein
MNALHRNGITIFSSHNSDKYAICACPDDMIDQCTVCEAILYTISFFGNHPDYETRFITRIPNDCSRFFSYPPVTFTPHYVMNTTPTYVKHYPIWR